MADLIDRLIEREGGYVNHALDRGGPTKFGITLDTLRWFRNRDVTPEDVRALTVEEARAIYDRRYLSGPRLAEVADPALRELLFDCAVHHGVKRAVIWLQRALGMNDDGTIGPQTLDALRRADPALVRRDVLRQRFTFIGQLITSNPSQAVFAHGWLRRIAEFV